MKGNKNIQNEIKVENPNEFDNNKKNQILNNNIEESNSNNSINISNNNNNRKNSSSDTSMEQKKEIINSESTLKIKISNVILGGLQIKYLRDLIKIIIKHCKLTIDKEYASSFQSEIFSIKENKKKKGYTLLVNHLERKKIKISIEDKFIKKNKNIIARNDEKTINDNNKKKIDNNDLFEKNEIFYCPSHKKKFKSNEALINHCRATHKFKCLLCGNLFGILSKYNKHFKNCHNNAEENNISNKKKNKEEKYANINKKKFKCFECELIFDDNSSMLAHYNEIHKKKKIDEKNEEKKPEIKKEKKMKKEEENKKKEDIKKEEINTKKKFEKKDKKKEVENDKKQELESQEESQNTPKEKKAGNFVCYLDLNEFETEKGYIKHFKNCHPEDYPFYCYDCQKGFFSNNAIENHCKSKGHNE